MVTALSCLIPAPCAGQAPYVPGQPGAPWTNEELYAVRGHLHWILRNTRKALERVPAGPVSALNGQMFTGEQILTRYGEVIDEGVHLHDAVLPDIAKIIRLTFHDCLRDAETGGCNGCLNFNGMGVEGEGVKHQGCHKKQKCAKDSQSKHTDNNNLFWVARVLELIYENKKPPFAPGNKFKLQTSLKNSGKSRADLWVSMEPPINS